MFAGSRLREAKGTHCRSQLVFPFTVVLLVLSVFCSPSYGGGLSTPLGEVVIENLQIGQTYNLTKLAGIKLFVTNSSDQQVKLQVDILAPGPSELKHEAISIPDVSWVRVDQNQFDIEAQGTIATDIVMSIPYDRKYLGMKFQVMIWSHTMPGDEGGMYLAYGLKSRIIFSIDREVASETIGTIATGSARVEVSPTSIHASNIDPGQEIDLTEQTGEFVTVTNSGDETANCRLTSKTVSTSLVELTDNYEEAPSGSVLRFSDDQFQLLPGESKMVRMYLELPEHCDCRGGNYMFIIHASTEDTEVVTGAYSRLYVDVQ